MNESKRLGLAWDCETPRETMASAKVPPANSVVYLAAPYSHEDNKVREERYKTVTSVAADLVSKGKTVFSPLTMTHAIDVVLQSRGMLLDSEFWVDFDRPFMEMCSEIVVLKLDGWESSRGIANEIEFFKSKNRPVHFLNPIVEGPGVSNVTAHSTT